MTKDSSKANELYWLAEELKAYTDLSGNRFDTDSALRRMFPMRKHTDLLHALNLHELYGEMIEMLEHPMFFQKVNFSKNVDQFYDVLENARQG